jgi:PAS domain S-box-containing protein
MSMSDAMRSASGFGEDLFRLLVETVQEYAIFAMDAEGRVVYWNDGAARMTGYDAADMLGEHVDHMYLEEDVRDGVPDRELLKARETGRAEDERWHVRKDGARYFAFGVVVPLRAEDGRLRGYGKILRDQTDAKEMEEMLRDRAESLLDADERRSIFVATLAHELRNVLAPLANGVQILKMQDRPESRRVADILDRQVRQMRRLVDDLMDATRISRGKLQLHKQPIVLGPIVHQAVDTTRPLMDSRRHQLFVYLPQRPVELDADPDRLHQVLVNLLTNAAKYTEPGGQITLDVEREDREAIIRVRDTGIGIPPEQMASIFELFTQAHSSKQSQGGLGIGLALVRDLVNMHGGAVQAKSDGVGKGSEFIVRLPLPDGETGAQTGRG